MGPEKVPYTKDPKSSVNNENQVPGLCIKSIFRTVFA